MLSVSKLSKTFQSGENSVRALQDVSLEVGAGKFVAVVGKSGSGKSTLLALLGALDQPSSGSVKVDNEDITNLSDRQLVAYRRQRIGFVFQNYNLIPNLSALQNVMLPLEFAGVRQRARQQRAQELLERVGLDATKQQRRPGRLSGGEQQRVAIARALANRPKLILADEPTGNLDSATGQHIISLLHQLARDEQTTIVAVTHDPAIAKQVDRTFRLQDGKLIGSAA